MIITTLKCILQGSMSTIKTTDFKLELKFKNEKPQSFLSNHP